MFFDNYSNRHLDELSVTIGPQPYVVIVFTVKVAVKIIQNIFNKNMDSMFSCIWRFNTSIKNIVFSKF